MERTVVNRMLTAIDGRTSLERLLARDGTSEGVKKAWETRKRGGGAAKPGAAKASPKVVGMLKNELQKAGSSGTAGKTFSIPGRKEVFWQEPKSGDDPFKNFKERSESENTSGPAHTGEVQPKKPEPKSGGDPFKNFK